MKPFATLLFSLIILSNAHANETEAPLIPPLQYRPIYMLVGTPDTKTQLSLKGQILKKFPLYFAYTQLMMWDLGRPSVPFRDINFNPELFYRLSLNDTQNQWLDFGIFEHESNGRDGADSRSWNRIYLLYHSAIESTDGPSLLWSIKAWIPFFYDPNTPDFTKYRGLWELNVTVTQLLGPFFGKNELTLRLYSGGNSYLNPLLGGQEITLRFDSPIKALAPQLMIQGFHGYGENMLNYKEERFGLRAGIGF